MSDQEPTGGDTNDLQFEHAEYAEPTAAGSTCVVCQQPIETEYYTVNTTVCCAKCLAGLEAARQAGSGFGRFVRATVYGSIAAACGAGLYFAIAALTGYEFALVAIVVGLLVGFAVRAGSRERGGWAYQGLAMFLTYSAIVATYVPGIIEAAMQSAGEETPAATSAPTSAAASRPASAPSEVQDDADDANRIEQAMTDWDATTTGEKIVGLAVFMIFVIVVAFIGPFLMGTENIIGLLIIAIALYEAWKINKRATFDIAGPFALGADGADAPPPPPPG